MPPPALPLALLLLALSTVFLFGNDRGGFYRSVLHDGITANHMAVAKNLSPKHDFLLFNSLKVDREGDLAYRPYNRFPISGYALLKLATLPFEGDFSAEIRAARALTLAFFVCIALLAWLALCRLTASRWAALAATLLSFSSFYLLYYNDMVATENMLSLFGVMLAFHGMVVFIQEDRFRQLLAKACAALLLGWHVYALLLAFIVLGLTRESVRMLPSFTGFGRSNRAQRAAPKLGRWLTLGIVTVLFGGAILSFNLGKEYFFAFGGQIPLAELPTVRSVAERFGASGGFNARFAEQLAWPAFLESQFGRIGGMTLPYGLIEPIWGTVVDHSWETEFLPGMSAWGIIAGGVCLVGLPFTRHRMLLAVLAISGFCWALPMRHNVALHEYTAVFYVGVPLTVFSLIFLWVRRLLGDRFVPILTAAALPVFVLSSAEMAGVGDGAREAAVEADLMHDFEAIRGRVGEGVMRLPPDHWRKRNGLTFDRMEYFLSGNPLVPAIHPRQDMVDFVLLHHRDEGPALLTPDNRRVFLYDRVLHDASYDEPALGAPIIASDWNVYLKDGRLVWVSEDCANVNSPFFLSMTPREGSGPAGRERRGIDGMEFGFRDVARRAGGKCVAVIELPSHDLLAVRTGQAGEEGLLWEGEHDFGR